MISTEGKTSPYLCNSYSAVHIGKYVIKLLKLSMCLVVLLSWEMYDIFSISIIHRGFKRFAAFPYKVTSSLLKLGQALPLMEKAVHMDSGAGCTSPSSQEMQGSGRRGKKWLRFCSRAMQLQRDPSEAFSPLPRTPGHIPWKLQTHAQRRTLNCKRSRNSLLFDHPCVFF